MEETLFVNRQPAGFEAGAVVGISSLSESVEHKLKDERVHHEAVHEAATVAEGAAAVHRDDGEGICLIAWRGERHACSVV